MSEILHFSAHRLQEVALVFMALVYITRIAWLLRFKAGKERQPQTGRGRVPGQQNRSIIYSWFNIAMPGQMESTRLKPFFYAQFVIFHVGVATAIALSFVIPYGPGLLNGADGPTLLVPIVQVICGAACLVGLARVYRRLTNPYIRAISSPDDIFAPILLTAWLAFAVLAAPNRWQDGEWELLGFFISTAFFLVYVPFSKISHYLYYPFTRYYLGKTMGRRGTFPLERQPKPAGALSRAQLGARPVTQAK